MTEKKDDLGGEGGKTGPGHFVKKIFSRKQENPRIPASPIHSTVTETGNISTKLWFKDGIQTDMSHAYAKHL